MSALSPGKPSPAPQGPPPSRFASAYRTHTCGELRKAHAGLAVKLCGALDAQPEDRLLELRDAHGTTRVRLLEKAAKETIAQLGAPDDPPEKQVKKIPLESILAVSGKVVARPAADASTPTGEVLLEADSLLIESQAKAPLLFDHRSPDVPRRDRIRHRYLWLRNKKAHETFGFKTRILAEARRFLASRGCDEVTTPLLAGRWNPEDKDALLAIRDRAKLFALPGRRTIHGPLLMAGGFDRTFEVGRRFQRRKAYGPWQQPEFSVLDMNLAWVGLGDLLAFEDALLGHVWKAALEKDLGPVRTITWEESLAWYGTTSPDLRYDLAIHDVTRLGAASTTARVRESVGAGGALRALKVPGGAGKLAEADLAALASEPKLAMLVWLPAGKDGKVALGKDGKPTIGPREAAPEAPAPPAPAPDGTSAEGTAPPPAPPPPLDEATAEAVLKALDAKEGDLVLVAISKGRTLAAELAGRARTHAGTELKLAGDGHALVRISEIPYFQWDARNGGWQRTGDPLIRPLDEDAEGDPHRMRAMAHDLVLDGVNIGGGAIRNHDLSFQRTLLKRLGYDMVEVDQRFGRLFEVLKFGVPPHGRILIGSDRLVALLRGLDGVDEVIALPKMPEGNDPLTRAPTPMGKGVARGLLGI